MKYHRCRWQFVYSVYRLLLLSFYRTFFIIFVLLCFFFFFISIPPISIPLLPVDDAISLIETKQSITPRVINNVCTLLCVLFSSATFGMISAIDVFTQDGMERWMEEAEHSTRFAELAIKIDSTYKYNWYIMYVMYIYNSRWYRLFKMDTIFLNLGTYEFINYSVTFICPIDESGLKTNKKKYRKRN